MTPDTYKLIYHGEAGVTLTFSSVSSEQLTNLIQQLATYLRQHLSLAELEVIPAYQSLTIYQAECDCFVLENKLQPLLSQFTPSASKQGQHIEIPVCYEPEFAPDMPYLCEHTGLSTSEIIQRHTQTEYLVHMLGFLPGFLYLGDLDPKLACPRKKVPDMQLAAGSVAIGGSQTGVYPLASPGGWHVIGRTPVPLFRPEQQQAFVAQPLDRIRFVPITSQQYQQWPQGY